MFSMALQEGSTFDDPNTDKERKLKPISYANWIISREKSESITFAKGRPEDP